MFSVLVIRLRSLRLLRVSGIVMRLRMFLLLITFLKASHSFRNRLLVICKNAYLFATMIMTSVSSPFSCCSGIVRFFERIEALKPAIEACGISTLSQSPMLGFHKQMDNRIKLLEEILSFRMQGVEFDNGDMYVDGHKAASDVRDEFVSVTEKLMDELAQCYNVLP